MQDNKVNTKHSKIDTKLLLLHLQATTKQILFKKKKFN